MKNVVQSIGVWGDSLLKGVVFDDLKGKYETLKNTVAVQCAKLLGLRVDNNARFGATVTKGCRTLTRALDRGVECDAIVIEYGGNDCDYNWPEVARDPDGPHEPHTPLDDFKRVLRMMIMSVKQKGIQPVLMSLPPLDAGRYFNWITRSGLDRDNILRFLGDVGHIYRHQERYSIAVTNLAMEQQCHYIDVRDAFLAQPHLGQLLCSDGIHPNDTGHRVIRETFVTYLSRLA